MRTLKQSTSARALVFLMVDSTDHITGKTGLTPTVTLSKNGGSFGSPSGAVSEIGNGLYKVAGNTTDSDTLGSLILHATATGADPVDIEFEVVAYDPQSATNLGLSNLDATISSRQATVTFPTNFSSLAITGAGAVTTGTVNDKTGYSLSSSQSFNLSGNITGNLSGSVGSVSGDVSGKVLGGGASSITGDGVRASSVTGAVGSVTGNVGGNVTGSVGSVVGAVGSVTGNVGGNVVGSVNSVTSAVTVGTINAGVITAASIATDAIDADAIASDAVSEIQSGLSTLTAGQVENAVWDATFVSHTTAGTYGGRIPRSDSSNVEVKLTGSAHIAADVHEVQPGTFVDADYDAGSTYAKLATLIEADPVSGYRYTTQALEQAPAGGGGGGGSTTVRMGPFEIKADGGGADQPLDLQKGATHGIDCTLVDGTGTGVDLTGATLSAKVYNSAGTLVETLAGTTIYAAGGLLTWTITTTTTNTAGTYTATITRTTGASDTQVFGPLRIYVREV